MSLSPVERLILRNQFKILGYLEPDEADSHARARHVLEEGWEREIQELFLRMPLFSSEKCKQVADVIDMFSAMQRSFESLTEKTGIDEADVVFVGFDGNSETEEFSYAKFLLQDEGKWKWLKTGGDGLNSHSPTDWRYQPMLRHWIATGKKGKMSKVELLDLLQKGKSE